MTLPILLVEDDRALREALADTLELGGYRYRAVDSGEAALLALAEESFGLVISDVNMPGIDGHQLLASIRLRDPALPVLLMTAFGSIERAVEAMRGGAADYLVKPFEPRLLLETLARCCPQGRRAPGGRQPVAADPQSRQLLELASRVARSEATVLITGESGTGKEVLARFIHDQSARADGPFVAVNCAAIPDHLLEAILFGHEKGAFTGAIAAQPGKFELAQGGTLLLDEISEMPQGLQAKLLRVLQEREVERVGARKPLALDIRVVATSSRKLAEEVAAGRFREDLFYRLSVFPLAWLPLRERPADIVPLAERLLAVQAARMNRPIPVLSPAARQALAEHPWPGNVRELDNAVQRALILQPGQQIQAEDFGLHWLATGVSLTPAAAPVPATGTGDDVRPLDADLRDREFQVILDTLRAERGRRKETAERLGISARTLRYKLAQMRDAGLDVELALAAGY
ncbi:sigma-54 dependent transcriptional regulator [Pseudomonas sp. CBMAI 2609]|uniref:Sigma-54 dependent transcriptional regulator n=1 Tax=Pseudomonas flavocrustae TaxID=2991719 RepID=A0ABT6IB00_9PSED|nr:sigma-54 dependent transcriptional regulator [Pseudomonas sp. CBMAI 2609]MDH4761688.1 sigma-54 dependent transcriptional regulator [Pseudomonas sp. CBMAI 2609]